MRDPIHKQINKSYKTVRMVHVDKIPEEYRKKTVSACLRTSRKDVVVDKFVFQYDFRNK